MARSPLTGSQVLAPSPQRGEGKQARATSQPGTRLMLVPPRNADAFAKAPPPGTKAVLLFGPDLGLVRERAEALMRTVVEDPADPFRVSIILGPELRADPARLADEAMAIAMLGGRRVVRVRDADNTHAATFKSFLDDPKGDALVIAEAGDLDRKGALARTFGEAGNHAAAIICYEDDDEALEQVIEKRLAAHALSADPDAMDELIRRLGDDRKVTAGEIEKLALYMGPGDGKTRRAVTREHVRAIIGTEAEADLSDIADAVAMGDLKGLERAYAASLAGGGVPESISRSCLMHFLRLSLAGALVERGASAGDAVMRAFWRMPPKRQALVERQARLWPALRSREALNLLAEAEIAAKSSNLPKEAMLGRTLMQVASLARAGR